VASSDLLRMSSGRNYKETTIKTEEKKTQCRRILRSFFSRDIIGGIAMAKIRRGTWKLDVAKSKFTPGPALRAGRACTPSRPTAWR